MNIIDNLVSLKCLKTGNFILSSGKESNFYVDLRILQSHPKTMKIICTEMINLLHWYIIKSSIRQTPTIDYSLSLCGVPYGGVPYSSVMSIISDIPSVMLRKEPKKYGTKKLLEGDVSQKSDIILIDDVMTSGKSILEAANMLRNEGYTVKNALVILDRQENGKEFLQEHNIDVFSLLKISDVKRYMENNKTSEKVSIPTPTLNPSISQKLKNIILSKKSNLCVAVDVKDSKTLIDITRRIAPHICILKTHIDILRDFSKSVVNELVNLSREFNFLIMEDRKIADIGTISKEQIIGGIYNILDWADIITVHPLVGEGAFDNVITELQQRGKGFAPVLQMSSSGNLIDEQYSNNAYKLIKKYQEQDIIAMVVCQKRFFDDKSILIATPGVNTGIKEDGKGQTYRTPEEVFKIGTNIAIIGREIYKSDNPQQTAKNLQEYCWDKYMKVNQ
jgi:uridine monophosphate synthetase